MASCRNGYQVKQMIKNEEWDLVLEHDQVTLEVNEAISRCEARVVPSPQVPEGVTEQKLDYEAAIEEQHLYKVITPHFNWCAVEFSCFRL